MFEVRGMFGDQLVRDLDGRTCLCRRWDLTGICPHAMSAIWYSYEKPEQYVANCYKSETYLRAYDHVIYYMNEHDMWVKTNNPPVLPQKYSKMPGRPRKTRIREPDELPKHPNKLRKYQNSLKCRKCGKIGHNTRTCKAEQREISNRKRKGKGKKQ